MNRAARGILASTLLISVGYGGQAWAESRVVVEQFSGDSADSLRKMAVKALAKQAGVVVISDKKVAAAEADLGLLQVSDSYSAAARELKATGFVGGSVSGKKKLTARLSVRDAEGNVVGTASWTGANDRKLMAEVGKNLSAKLGAMVADLGDGGGAKPERPKAVEVAQEETKPKRSAAREEAAPEAKAAAESDSSEQVASSRSSRNQEETISESAESASSSSGSKGFDIAVGTRVYSRKFTYNEDLRGGHQPYKLSAAPAPNVEGTLYVHPMLALTGSFEYSVALFSKDANDDIYKTKSFAYSVGAKGRYAMGTTDLTAIVVYGSHLFEVNPLANDPNPPKVAGVDYKHVRVGGDVRMPLSDTTSIMGGASYLHLLSLGALRDEYFPGATGRGGEGHAGLAIALPWKAGLEARAMLEVRRYVFAMNSLEKVGPGETPDTHVAGGAIDQYVGLNLAVAFGQ